MIKYRRTLVLGQTAGVIDKEVGKGAVDVGAHLLARLGRAKDADDGDPGLLMGLREAGMAPQLGIEAGGRGAVVVDAVEPDAEHAAAVAVAVAGHDEGHQFLRLDGQTGVAS